MNLSDHFSLAELTFSQVAARKGISNEPTLAVTENLTRLCADLLEPIRTLLGVPMRIDSGYRSPLVNEAVGGANDSAHLTGRAADLVPIEYDLQSAFDAIRKSDLPIDQVIFECRAWVHVAIAPAGVEPRHEALIATGHAGAWHYERVA